MIRPSTLFPVSRRRFLAGCCAVGACPRLLRGLDAAPAAASLLPSAKARVRLVFTHPKPERQGWPYQGYDYESRKRTYTARLRQACPNIEFLPATAISEEEARPLADGKEGVDGYLVYLLGIPSNAGEVFAYSGRPTLLVDDLYGGTGRLLGLYPSAVRKGMPVAAVASSRFEDVVEAVKAFECINKLKSSVLLDVTERELGRTPKVYKETLGLSIRRVAPAELNAAYERAGAEEAQRWAEAWSGAAERIVEPDAAEIRRSAAMHLAMLSLLSEHKAQAIAVDCLRLFYDGKMPAYPCLGFFQLNNDGLVGACEADLMSAATMLMMVYLTGRPGYISDPVIDTSANQVIYAHCVAPNKVYGPRGPANPYEIRSHSEDRKGAAVRSLMPLGEITTTLKLIPDRKLVVLHQARTVANLEEDRACRTKLAAEVKDARKLLDGWDYGWHRVTVYGDFNNQVKTLSALLGFRVVEEG